MGENRKFKGGTIVLPCACEHHEQDKMYGKNRRLHNISSGDGKAACTVCGGRNTPADKNKNEIAALPAMGIKYNIPAVKGSPRKEVPSNKPVVVAPKTEGVKPVGTVTEIPKKK